MLKSFGVFNGAIPLPTTGRTASIEWARKIAEQALLRPKGLSLDFLVSDYGSMDEAGRCCRRLQTTFSTMRADARRRAQRISQENPYKLSSDTVGPYDKLAAYRDKLPNDRGWRLRLIPASMIDLNVVITDNDTGEVIDFFSEDEREVTELIGIIYDEFMRCEKAHIPYDCWLTADHKALLDRTRPGWREGFTNMFGWTWDGEQPSAVGPQSISPDALFGD